MVLILRIYAVIIIDRVSLLSRCNTIKAGVNISLQGQSAAWRLMW